MKNLAGALGFVLSAIVVLLALAWGAGRAPMSEAANTGPRMALNVTGADTSCNVPSQPTTCSVKVGQAFVLQVEAIGLPAGGYAGFQTEVVFGALDQAQRPSCSDEVVWPNESVCNRATGPAGQARHFAVTSLTPPFTKSNFTGDLLELDMTCGAPSTVTVLLPAWKSSGFGAVYHDVNGTEVQVKTVGQTNYDLDGNGSAEAVDLADTLDITCVEPVAGTGVATGSIDGEGGNPADDLGDGGPATSASLFNPTGVYDTGTASSVYIADTDNHRVRKITIAGMITTIAGNGHATGSIDGPGGNPLDNLGDGGPATSASLNSPRDVFVDSAGNIFIADSDNCRIRKVNAGNGTISTVAGNGTCTFAGDGGSATLASLKQPKGVFVDAAGGIFIADTENCRVRRVVGTTISTFAGSGVCGYTGDGGAATSATLDRPHDVYFLFPEDDLLIADTNNDVIRLVDQPANTIRTFAGNGLAGSTGDGGLATAARLQAPQSVAAEANTVLIADTLNSRIRRVIAATGVIDTVYGAAGELSFPGGVGIVPGGGAGAAGYGGAAGTGSVGYIIGDTGQQESERTASAPPGDTPSDRFRPTTSCGTIPGVSSIDWGLPLMMLGLLLGRRRLGRAFRVLQSVLRPGPRAALPAAAR